MAPLKSPRRFFRLKVKVDTAAELTTQQSMQSLGTGSMSPDGSITFCPSPQKAFNSRVGRVGDRAVASPEKLARRFLRKSCSFLRVGDLGIDATSIATQDSEESHPNFHHPSCDPPPGIELDPKEQWIVLNDCEGDHAPIAPVAIDRLADFGLTTSMNESMWTPDTKTERFLKKALCPHWMKETFRPGSVNLAGSHAETNDCLVWSGNFKHGLYGSDLPAIRAAGVVNMSARALMELLVDSNRVKEYNKMSLGRTDLKTFQDDIAVSGPFGNSVTKIMKSESKPPMLRKTLMFVSILHARELIDGSGYLIVTRAVHHPDAQGNSNVIQSEILMGVNLIRKIEGAEESKCLMINVNHIRSPMVPMMVAKRIGVSAAIAFINDVRSIC